MSNNLITFNYIYICIKIIDQFSKLSLPVEEILCYLITVIRTCAR